VRAAALSDDVIALSRRLPRTLRLGASSWAFPGWAGTVYERAAAPGALAREGLRAYARHPALRAVGLDRTYYAPIDAAAFRALADATPADFRFLVKAHEACVSPRLRSSASHGAPAANPLFLDACYAAEQVVAPCVEGLGDKLACLLFQFPPLRLAALGGARRLLDRAQAFLRALPAGPTYAVELRNSELFQERQFAALRATGVRHCYNVHPQAPPLERQMELCPPGAGGLCLVRWMLRPTLDYESARERYEPFDALVDEDPPTRRAIARLCLSATDGGAETVVIANNKAEGCAPRTLLKLAEEIDALSGGAGGL